MNFSKKLAACAALLMAGNIQPFAANYDIGTWSGFKTSAVTFSFDDALANQYKVVVPMFNERGMTATFNAVCSWVGGGNSWSWNDAKAMVAAGHEIGSHTMTHTDLDKDDYLTQMQNSKAAIEQNVGTKCLTIAYPDCVEPKSLDDAARLYIGGRICNGQIEGPTPQNFFRIGSLICGNQGSYNSLDKMKEAINGAKNKKGWVVFLIHAVDNDQGFSPLSSSIIEGSLNYLQSSPNDYWVSTFANICKYIKERNSAKVTEKSSTPSSVTLAVADNLDNDEYDYPLSIRFPLPAGWDNVTCTQAGEAMTVNVSDGYIYFEAVPDAGDIVIESGSSNADLTASFVTPAAAAEWTAGTKQAIEWKFAGSEKSDNKLVWVSGGGKTINGTSAKASSQWCTEDGTFCWKAENVLSEGSDRWAASATSYSGEWLEIDFNGTETVAGAVIDECTTQTGTVGGYEIQYKENDAWKTAYSGAEIGEMKSVSFPAVRTSAIRLYIKSAGNVNINYFAGLGVTNSNLKTDVAGDGRYEWTIPAEYAGTEGHFALTTASGYVVAVSPDITIKSAGGSDSGAGSTPYDGTVYTGPSCDGSGTGAYYTGEYSNLFVDVLGKTPAEVDKKIQDVWNHFFTPGGTNSVYYEVGNDMAYIYDTGNQDVRTEGMSYGMMICVQLDHQKEFNKIWRWAKKYMQYQSGDWDGYFAWQCGTDGSIKGQTCAPDGEEYFITALFFAAHRWGNNGEIDYNAEAQNILKKIQAKSGSGGVQPMFNKSNKLVTFVPYYSSADISDPSYCLPGFLELWARWSETNKDFWAEAAQAARGLLKASSHAATGLFPDYCEFNGQPTKPSSAGYDTKQYKYDAIRCAMNVGMDFNWFRSDSADQTAMMDRLLGFFKKDGYQHGYFDWDGNNASGTYSEGMSGANGVACFAVSDAALAKENLNRLWQTTAPSGQWRYYNGMVYFLSMLNVSGNFRIYKPAPAVTDTTVKGEWQGVKYENDTVFRSSVDCKIYNVTVVKRPSLAEVVVGETADVTIFPNPASDVVEIGCKNGVKSVVVSNAVGAVVVMGRGSKINISKCTPGVYIMRVQDNAGNTIYKKLWVR